MDKHSSLFARGGSDEEKETVSWPWHLLGQGEVEGHVHEDTVASHDSPGEVVVEQLSVAVVVVASSDHFVFCLKI